MNITPPLRVERLQDSPKGIVIYAKQIQFRTGVMTGRGPVGVGIYPKFPVVFTGVLNYDQIGKICVGDMIIITV